MTESCADDRLRRGDRTLIPMWPDDLSINETHSAIFGGALGFAIGATSLIVRTILREPWYFVGALALGYGAGRAFFR